MSKRGDDGYDDRPKLSWSEIDKRRDGSRRSGSRQTERPAAKGEYNRYKSAADKFFSGELLPESMSERLDPTGEGRARREALKKLDATDDFKTFAALAKDYVATYGMPEDPYLLDRLLGHPQDSLVLQTLAEINRRLDVGDFKAPKTLPARLQSLELGSDDDEVQEVARALRQRLRG